MIEEYLAGPVEDVDSLVNEIVKEVKEYRAEVLKKTIMEANLQNEIDLSSAKCQSYLEKGTPSPMDIVLAVQRQAQPKRKRQKTSKFE